MPKERKAALDVDRIREAAAKTQNDPAIEVIASLAESLDTSLAVQDEEIASVDEKHTKNFAALDKKIEQARTESAVVGKAHADRLNTLDKRSVALGITGHKDIDGQCLAALGDEARRDIALIDWAMPSTIRKRKDDLPLHSNPIAATLIAHWFLAQYKLQKRRYQNQAEQNTLFADVDRYEKALGEMFPRESAAALITSTSGLGGSFIPDPVAAELYRLILDNSIFGPLATHVPMATKQLELPVEGSSGLTVTWGTENVAITDSVPSSNATSKVSLVASRLNGLAVSSIEEIQDSAISILSWIQTKLTEMAGREIDNQILEGSGSPFTGLIGATGVNVVGSLGVTTGANGDAITYGLLVRLIFAAREMASRRGAQFFCSPESMAKILGLVDTTGQPIVTFGRVPEGVAPQILGYPVQVHSVISSSRTYGTGTTLSTLYFGPPSQVVIGDRMGMSWDVSDQVGFTAAQVNMRLMTRLAIGIAVPKAFTREPNVQTT